MKINARNLIAVALLMQMLGAADASARSATTVVRPAHDATVTVTRFFATAGGTSATTHAPSISSAGTKAAAPSPEMMDALAQLDRLRNLNDGWGEDGAGTEISGGSLARAKRVLAMAGADVSNTFVYPDVDGGVLMEWDNEEDTLRIALAAEQTTLTFLPADRVRRARLVVERDDELRAAVREYFGKLRGNV